MCKRKRPKRTWRKVKRFLFVTNAAMSQQSGWGSAQPAIVGIAFLSKRW